MLPLLEKSPLKNLPHLRLKFKKLQCFTKTHIKSKNRNLKHYIRIKRRESILIFLSLPKQKGKKKKISPSSSKKGKIEAEVEAVQAVYGDDWVKIQLKGLIILPKKKLAILRTEKEREIERSKIETQNSLSLLTNPNLFLQEYSIPSIQATGLFFNSIFFQFKIHIFVSFSLYY